MTERAGGLDLRATTILAVRRDGRVALAGDGQVTIGDTVVKNTAQKVRALREGSVLVGQGLAHGPLPEETRRSASRGRTRAGFSDDFRAPFWRAGGR